MEKREIKFRAWDKFQKKYVFEGFHILGEVACFGGIESVIHETWAERSKAMGHDGTLLALNDFEIEQFTGLKDLNGKDIYEGDIVYLGGYGDYDIGWPFIELYRASFENAVGDIKGNIRDTGSTEGTGK